MRFIVLPVLLLLIVRGYTQVTPPVHPDQRPRLVVGIVIDQMRWDYLYRYYNRYAPDGGFRRLINQGYSCENTFINYLPAYTACGHTCIYTGSVPAIHGITGNDWYDYTEGRMVYCAEDRSVEGVGTEGKGGKMSPRNMQATTICDELRLATNFRGKVIGVAIKDRGGILPAGHSANAAYWFDGSSGRWISSTYYMKQLPQWVNDLNAKKLPDSYFKQGWKTLYPLNTYVQSTADVQDYEEKPFGPDAKGLPYDLSQYAGHYSKLSATPYGNSFTKDMAIAAVNGERLGADSITDFLAVSFSSTDYVGHAFGPNSIEAEDTYLRLDRDLGELFHFLDGKVGKGQYLVFLSADHGAAHAAGFSVQNRLPGGNNNAAMEKPLDSLLEKKFGPHRFILAWENNQLFFDHHLMDSLNTDARAFSKTVIDYLSGQQGVERAFLIADAATAPLAGAIRTRVINGYYPTRSGDVQIILKPGWMTGEPMGTTHGSWNPYDTHIPLLWYGWKIKPGKTNREVYMTDIAPTLAGLLHIQMPSGCVGQVITEITN